MSFKVWTVYKSTESVFSISFEPEGDVIPHNVGTVSGSSSLLQGRVKCGPRPDLLA